MPNGGFLTLVVGSQPGGLGLNASVSANCLLFLSSRWMDIWHTGSLAPRPLPANGCGYSAVSACLEEARPLGVCRRGAESEWAAARLISGAGWPSENYPLRHAKQNRELAVGKSQVSDGLPLFT